MITVQNTIISKEQVLAIVAGQGISWTLVLNFYLHAIILRYHLLKLTTSEFTYALNEYTSETQVPYQISILCSVCLISFYVICCRKWPLHKWFKKDIESISSHDNTCLFKISQVFSRIDLYKLSYNALFSVIIIVGHVVISELRKELNWSKQLTNISHIYRSS